MKIRLAHALAAAACAATVAGLAPAADAIPSPGPGTYTRITTPGGDITLNLNASSIPGNTFTVAGTASTDVASVDIRCLNTQNGALSMYTFAFGVPVHNGGFNATVHYLAQPPDDACRLRAIPSNIANPLAAYLDAYAGPVLYSDYFYPTADANGVRYAYLAQGQQAGGSAQVGDAGLCGIIGVYPGPNLARARANATDCMAALPGANINPAGPANASALVVDGHNAYLPEWVEVIRYTVNAGFALPPLTTTFGIAANGDETITESAPLVRCADDTYPPTKNSCSTIAPTGVTFIRTNVFTGNGRQVLVHDTYASADGVAHTLTAEYHNGVQQSPTGSPAFAIPAHPGVTTFNGGETLTGFGAGAATLYFTADKQAWPAASDTGFAGLTWSRPPSAIVVPQSVNPSFGLRYALPIPAAGANSLGFAVSETTSIPATQALAGAAEAEVMSAPSISSPANGATIGTQATTVTGTVAVGANGFPTSVTVNGHAATVTPVNPTTATFSARFAQSWGRHNVTVVATDAGGNTRSASIAVRNAPALGVKARPRVSRGSLVVPVSCQRFAASTCGGKVVVKSARGAVIGSSRAFTVGRGRSASVGVRIRPGNHVVRVYLYQREPTGAYVLVSAKPYRI